MSMTVDDSLLFSTGATDGLLCMFGVREKEGRLSRRLNADETTSSDVPWSEVVLVTISDLEERKSTMLELQNKVDELTLHNEYQLRLKEMNYKDQLKELQVTYDQEIEALKVRLQMQQSEKDKDQAHFEKTVVDHRDTSQRELQDCENQHNQKLLDQYEKFEKLQRKSQEMQERCERQLDELEKEKTRALEDLAEFWENKLLEKSGRATGEALSPSPHTHYRLEGLPVNLLLKRVVGWQAAANQEQRVNDAMGCLEGLQHGMHESRTLR